MSLLPSLPLHRLLPLPASQLGGDLAQQVARGPGPGVGQRAGVMRWRWGARRDVRRGPAVSDLAAVEGAPHRGAPGEAG